MGPPGQTTNAVSADVDRLLSPKSLEELGVLEIQISKKLQSNEPIDVEYWEQLLQSVAVYKAKAQLKNVYKAVIDSRLKVLKEQQIAEAKLVQEKLSQLSSHAGQTLNSNSDQQDGQNPLETLQLPPVLYSKHLDPEPLLKIRPEDKGLEVLDESEFMDKIVSLVLRSQSSFLY